MTHADLPISFYKEMMLMATYVLNHVANKSVLSHHMSHGLVKVVLGLLIPIGFSGCIIEPTNMENFI